MDDEAKKEKYEKMVRQIVEENEFHLDLGYDSSNFWRQFLRRNGMDPTVETVWIKWARSESNDKSGKKDKIEYATVRYFDGWMIVGTTREFNVPRDIFEIIRDIGIIQKSDYTKRNGNIVVEMCPNHMIEESAYEGQIKIFSNDRKIICDTFDIDKIINTIDEIKEIGGDRWTEVSEIVCKRIPQTKDRRSYSAPLSETPKKISYGILGSKEQIRKNLRKAEDDSSTNSLSEIWEKRAGGPDRSPWKSLRPDSFEDVIGQDAAIATVRATLASKWKRHMIFMGPPGVGKTTVARLCLEEAKGVGFDEDAPFVEYDCASGNHDEYNKISNLLGFVEDPTYRGSSSSARERGVPDIKIGAMSRAHRGILFLDEIGELPMWIMSSLLKTLEDGVYRLNCMSGNETWKNMTEAERGILTEGMPANFLMIGATTTSLEEINKALLSRCLIVKFKALNFEERIIGLKKTIGRAEINIEHEALVACARSENLRAATGNMLTAHGFAAAERHEGPITTNHVRMAEATTNNKDQMGFRNR